MNVSRQKNFCFVITTLAAGVILLFLSCSKKPANNESANNVLIGKWQVEGQQSTIEFKTDGTLSGLDGDEAQSGKYKFSDATHMKMEIDLGKPNESATTNLPASLAIDCEVKVQDNDNVDLSISMKMPGDDTPKNKDTAHLKRIK